MKIVNLSNKRKGFSFIEVIIAAVIVNLAIMGLFGAFFYGKAKVQSTKRQLMALNHAQELMEYLTSLDFDDAYLTIGTHSTEPSTVLPTSGDEGELRSYWSGTRTYSVSWGPNTYGNDPRYKIISVTVNWTEPSI